MAARLACTLLGGVWADRLSPGRIMVASDVVRAAEHPRHRGLLRHRPGQRGPALRARRGHRWGSRLLRAGLRLAASAARRRSTGVTRRTRPSTSCRTPPSSSARPPRASSSPGPARPGPSSSTRSPSSCRPATVAAIRVDAPRAPRVGMLAELREGWREVTSRSWLLAGLLAATAYHAAFGAVVVLIDVMAVRDLGGPTALGWISAASGAGRAGGWPARAAAAAASPALRGLAVRGADGPVRGGVRVARAPRRHHRRRRGRLRRADVLLGLLGHRAAGRRPPRGARAGVVVGHPHVVRGDPGRQRAGRTARPHATAPAGSSSWPPW